MNRYNTNKDGHDCSVTAVLSAIVDLHPAYNCNSFSVLQFIQRHLPFVAFSFSCNYLVSSYLIV